MTSGYPVLPVFLLDTDILQALTDKADRRVDFIHRVLTNVQATLQQHHTSLFVHHGTPEEMVMRLMETFDIRGVYANHDYEPYAIQRDERIRTLLGRYQIPFHTFKDQVVFEKAEVVKADGSPYTIFTPYAKAWKGKYAEGQKGSYPSENHLSQFHRTEPYALPTLEEIGFQKTDLFVPPLQPDQEIIRHYEETRNLPYLEGTTRLSVHLRFGTVSVRELAAIAWRLNDQWLNELIWREFFMMILFHFPHVVTQSFKAKYDNIPWRHDEDEFAAWCSGHTGYPLVDAGMRELNATGFMHNRVRMVVASFLTKHLLIDWRRGEAYFAEKLLDYELSSNNGNWQWCAGCGCDAAPYFRIFNPTEQQKKFDPDMIYIRKWIPEYAPGYIEPIVEHAFARNRVLAVFKEALQKDT